MKTDFLRTLAALAILALLAPVGTIQAQDIQLASHAELNDLYARLAELESRVAASNVSGGCGCADAAGCGNGCGDCCDDCCGNPGFVGGAEILWLTAYHAEGDFGNFDGETATRFWVGYQGADGLGVRVRWFDFDHREAAAGGVGPNILDISHVDVEIYDSFQLSCNWDLVVGAGVRYMDYFDLSTGGDIGEIAGFGPVVTVEAYRHISDRAALYVIARESIVGGDGNVVNFDVTTNVFEMQIGGQLHRDYNGGLLFARAGWEAQYYADNMEFDSEGISLMGFTASVGLMR